MRRRQHQQSPVHRLDTIAISGPSSTPTRKNLCDCAHTRGASRQAVSLLMIDTAHPDLGNHAVFIDGTSTQASSRAVQNHGVTDMRRKLITVNDTMQQNYTYELFAPAGRNFHAGFEPELSPKEMLKLGVFGGKYMTDTRDE